MLTTGELMEEHVKEYCKYCTLKECDGIRVTINGKTKCAKEEKAYGMFNNK